MRAELLEHVEVILDRAVRRLMKSPIIIPDALVAKISGWSGPRCWRPAILGIVIPQKITAAGRGLADVTFSQSTPPQCAAC